MSRGLVFIWMVMLAGCAIGPEYHRPSAPSPPAFREPPPDGWKEAEPREGLPRGPWWGVFNDAQLDALEGQVSLSNQNVVAALAQYREARDQVRVARSGLFPTVTATPAITRIDTPAGLARGGGAVSSSGTTVGIVAGSVTDYSLPVDVSYQADVWGSIRRSVAAGRDTAQASAADLENARLTYQAQLAQMYFQLHGLDSDAELLERTLALYQQSLDLTRERLDVGVVSGADVAQAETQLATTRAQLIDIGVARAQYEHAIAILVGKAPADLVIPRVVLSATPPAIPIGLPSALMERRPDVTAMERSVAAANEQIGIAKAAFFPNLLL